MKICWDNLDGIYLTKGGNFKKGSATYIEIDFCKKCGCSYLTERSRPSVFCGQSCYRQGYKHTEDTNNSRANKDRKWHKAWYKAIINKRYSYRY